MLDANAPTPQLLRMTFNRKTVGACCVALALALPCAAPASHAGDLPGARIESLRGDLQSLRRRVERAPRASVFGLKQLQRRLAEQRVEAPDDPRLDRLELQRRHAQWQVERALRQGRAAASRARLAETRDQLAVPGYLRPATDLDIRGAALPIGTGKLFLFIQSGLSEARVALGRGQSGVAAGHLERAESGYRALRDQAGADDPNLVALAAEIAALRAAVGVAGRG
jgi:hypothetical protein